MTGVRIAVLSVLALSLLVAPASAQEAAGAGNSFLWARFIGGGLGAAVTILGAAFGIGRIGSAAVESMSRQPEVAPHVQTAMIISAALIEGATFLSLVICLLALFVGA